MGYTDIVKLLIENGANVYAKGKYGKPSDYAFTSGHKKLGNYLEKSWKKLAWQDNYNPSWWQKDKNKGKVLALNQPFLNDDWQ